MDSLHVLYKNIYSKLKEMEDSLIYTYQKIDSVKRDYDINVDELQKEINDVVKSNMQLEDKINAFINIASTHTSKLFKSTVPMPFDSGKLSRLAVQINSNNGDDPFATELYTEATGQKIHLELERKSLEENNHIKFVQLETIFNENIAQLKDDVSKVENKIYNYLKSDEFQLFISMIKKEQEVFNGDNKHYISDKYLAIGSVKLPIPIPKGFEYTIAKETDGFCDVGSKTLCVPIKIDISRGSVLIAEYENGLEMSVLNGIQNMIINIMRYFENNYAQICFIDPIRFNSSALGCLSRLCADNGIIDSVPSSVENIKMKLKTIIAENSIKKERNSNSFYVFHDFPHGYDAAMIAQIQQLCVNAKHYGVTVILTHNKSVKNYAVNDNFTFIQSISSTNINVENGLYNVENSYDGGNYPFIWYQAPSLLPIDIEKKFVIDRKVTDLSNDYNKRIGFASKIEYQKGNRKIDKIPYGIDNQGNLQYLNFEDSNFATFICGASRSGKSTLLHTLISGMIMNNHPDDIEIWLIDFKMTEFSRYINHLPPHIRYIILDESPELVYDIIDRLTEILMKRQNIFKGKWLKLDDVPAEKYMPAIMVIIDEFSVMSQIIADSIISNNENYSVKLQMLLAKGAALGIHFIFSSQGFTNGTRGLSDFSKQQIQQRIAMKTEFIEIKNTLDLKSASENDKVLMEQLPVHYALLKTNANEYGNHLKLSHVLFISDYLEQEDYIEFLNESFLPVTKYDVCNTFGYINKKPLIKDGNIYYNYADKIEEIREHIFKQKLTIDDEILLYVGEPRRMLTVSSIKVYNEFCENILMIAPNNEKMATSSIVISLTNSLELQNCEFEVWTSKRNPIYQQLNVACAMEYVYRNTLDAVCTQIRSIKEMIQSKIEGNKFFILLGFESILADMSFQTTNQNTAITKTSQLSGVIRKPNEPDLNIFLSSLSMDTSIKEFMADEVVNEEYEEEKTYDAREDLKYILTNGPRLGYHFMMVFNTVGDIYQNRVDVSLFKHKLLFRTSKTDASSLVGVADAEVISKLEDHSFRYNNGLDRMSFRPFLHKGLFWDGWQVNENGVINNSDEEDEYLM